MKRAKLYINFLRIGILLSALASVSTSIPCALRETEYGSVCVCNSTYCDSLDNPIPETNDYFNIVSSTKAGLRFRTAEGKFNIFKKYIIPDYDHHWPQNEPYNVNNVRATRYVRLQIDRKKRYQTIVGFGGAFTGTVSYIMEQLPQSLQDNVYNSYFSEQGIGFNLLRMPIGGSDFDLSPWAYNETPEDDFKLTNFTKLDPRDQIKVQQIQRLKNVTKVQNLRIKGAAWSPPRWMKSNNQWTGFSHLKKEYYQTWADYHIKWLELMHYNGLPVWAISTGNEPLNGVLFMNFVKFISLGWTPHNQSIWLSDHLGPSIRQSKFKDVLIFGNDEQRYTFPQWFNMMKSTRSDSIDYLDGLAVHWYWDEIFTPTFIDKALAKMSDKLLLSTESCIGDKPWQKAFPLLGSWKRAEKYIRAYLQDLQHNFNGWIDSNMILNEQGGPNYANNTVDAPIIANMTNRIEIYKQPIFYAIGHFSKFIIEGSIRIGAVPNNINIDAVAFLRPDKSISLIIFNSGMAKVEINIIDSIRGTIVINIPPKSIHTIIYK